MFPVHSYLFHCIVTVIYTAWMVRCCEEFTEDLTDCPLCMIHFIREPVTPIVLYIGRRVDRGT